MPARVPAEQVAFLKAICADPADDTARLVYADWLQEHDDEEQAQFIRDSIKHAGAKPYTKKWQREFQRLLRLGADRGTVWLKPLGIAAGPRFLARPSFERGIAESIFYEDPDEFFRERDALFRYLPLKHLGLGIGDGTGLTNRQLGQLARTRHLARLPSMELHYHMDCGVDQWRTFFHSPHLSGLTYLRIVGCDLDDDHAKAIATSPSLKGLTELELSDNFIGVGGCRALAKSRYLKKLTQLAVVDNDFGGDDEYEEAEELLKARFGDVATCSPADDDDDDDDD